jgi:hypothetical protein
LAITALQNLSEKCVTAGLSTDLSQKHLKNEEMCVA